MEVSYLRLRTVCTRHKYPPLTVTSHTGSTCWFRPTTLPVVCTKRRPAEYSTEQQQILGTNNWALLKDRFSQLHWFTGGLTQLKLIQKLCCLRAAMYRNTQHISITPHHVSQCTQQQSVQVRACFKDLATQLWLLLWNVLSVCKLSPFLLYKLVCGLL